MMTEPHSVFEYMRADEVAETWEGVTDEMYRSLWAIVAQQKPIPNKEDSGPYDHVGHENLKEHWGELTDEEHIELNRLAELNAMEV